MTRAKLAPGKVKKLAPKAKSLKKSDLKKEKKPMKAVVNQPAARAPDKSEAKMAALSTRTVEKVVAGNIEEPTTKLGQKWQNLYNKSKNLTPVPYKMSETYTVKMAIEHKILGLGFVIDNKNDRLEVLFRDGIRVLISNYKATK